MLSKILAFLLLLCLSPILISISILIFLSSGPPILFKQKRVGLSNKCFNLYKFRTMINDTPDIATHLFDSPSKYYIKYGKLIRELSLDELPQIYNIIIGDIKFIGPRPALYNQDDLILLRMSKGIHSLMPGITGWAQINGRDDLSISEKVDLDLFYKNNKSLSLDIKIIFITIYKVLLKKGV